MNDHPWGYDYWSSRLDEAQAEYDALPRWRWFKRSSLMEAIRATRQIVIVEGRVELDRLRKARGEN